MTTKLSLNRITRNLAFVLGLAALALLASCSKRSPTPSSQRM